MNSSVTNYTHEYLEHLLMLSVLLKYYEYDLKYTIYNLPIT